jgi:hypothetical protein
MALTNAERQARFQKRLREKARGVDLPQRVREMMDGAVAAVWSIINRPSDDGREWAEAYDFADLEDYRVYWARQARSYCAGDRGDRRGDVLAHPRSQRAPTVASAIGLPATISLL